MYADGVGTSNFNPLALLGGMFGVGPKENVLQCYKFRLSNLSTVNVPFAP
jgi:hypothetical protein